MRRRGWITVLAVLGAGALAVGGCADSTGPEYVAKVIMEPDSAHLEPGESVTFTAVPLGPLDQRYPDRAERVRWDVAGENVIDIEELGGGQVRVTALAVGEGGVQAMLGRGEGVGPVYVSPPGLASIEIQPSPIVLQRFRGTSIRAVLRDASGAEMSPEGFRVSWESSNWDVAFMSDNVRHQANSAISGRSPGRATLRLVVGPLTTQTSVTVTEND